MNPALSLLAVARDFALPARCPGCGVIVEDNGRFCLECWRALDLLAGGGCARCDRPLDGAPEGTICAGCLADPPIHDGVRAAVGYGDIARAIALKLKYSGRPAMAQVIAGQLERYVDRKVDGLLVPVPLHRWRIWSRGYNQSALIARALARRTGSALALGALERIKPTPLLRGLGAAARAKTVRGAFRIAPTAEARGRHIWLVDDVYTSGATANACAKVLKRAGAASVVVLCWARVLRDEE